MLSGLEVLAPVSEDASSSTLAAFLLVFSEQQEEESRKVLQSRVYRLVLRGARASRCRACGVFIGPLPIVHRSSTCLDRVQAEQAAVNGWA